MPDFNQFQAGQPKIRPESPDTGISQIVQPKYDYITTFPPDYNKDTEGNAPTFAINAPAYDAGKARRQKMLGDVTIAPAAQTDYNTSKRYDNPNILFNPSIDNEDTYAQNQTFLKSVGNGLGRLVGLTGTKLGTGVGYLAGLVGVDNDNDKYGGGFGGWIAGAADNGMAKYFQSLEDDKIKQDWFPIYKKANESEHGFFRHMGDLDFWTDDLTDGAAFIASSFIPGMGISKLKLGARALEGLATLRGAGIADEATALAEDGVKGVAEGVTPTNAVKPTPNATQEISRIIPMIDNAKLARSIDVGTTSFLNTASQAMFSANGAKNTAYDTLIAQKDENGNNKYTTDQARLLSAKVAKDSYLMNLGALGLMNLYEANFLFKKAGVANTLGAGNKFNTEGLFGDAALAEKTFGQRAYNAIKEPAKGYLTGGVWLGNMQLAIDRLNNNPDNFNLDFGDKLKLLGKQYLNQTEDAVMGSDTDASKALGVGGLMGAVLGKVLGHNELKQTQKGLADLNKQVSAFKTLDNVYKTESDGSLTLENGKPVLDTDKMKAWVASMNNVLSLQQVGRNFESRGVQEMSKLYQDEVFARFAKAHFDAGLSDVLHQKLSDITNIKKEDLGLLGFDPNSKGQDTGPDAQRLQKKAKDLENLYTNIQNNFVPPTDININTKEGQAKYFGMTDKMFYLSARSASINERIQESNTRYDEVRNNADTYNQSFNSDNDASVTKYNELFEDLEAAKRKSQQSYLNEVNSDVDYTKNGVSVNAPSRAERVRRENPSVNVTLPERNSVADNARVEERQKALDNYVTENKETLERLKKDSRGRYLFEVANKNLLPSVKEMERQQIVNSELNLANNATMNVLGRLADPRFGSRYYDEVYSKELERHAQEQGIYDDLTADEPVTKTPATDNPLNLPEEDKRFFKPDVDDNQINAAYDQAVNDGKVDNKKDISEHLANKIVNGEELSDKEEAIRQVINKDVEEKLHEIATKGSHEDLFNELDEVQREKEALDNKDDKTPEDEKRLDELERKEDVLKEQRQTVFDTFDNNNKVDDSKNIKPEDKPDYKEILKNILINKKRIQKFDDYYMVDGQRYRKVTDLIGDRISPEQREDPSNQAAVNAGNSIDALTKAYFAGDHNNPDFRASMSDKISEDAYNNVVKSLDKMKAELANKGIEIIGNNVMVADDNFKVAGEIDLLGVDKNGNFKIYEVQARRSDVYSHYGKRGLGVKIRDIDGKRLSMYRNMFANQYGSTPDEIAVKFPFEVKYDKTNYNGFIDETRMREPIRFTPLKNVEIKLKNGDPIRIGSHFESVDMTKIYLDTFLSNPTDQAKLKYIFRNATFDEISKGVKLTVRPSSEKFQKRYDLQQKALNKEDVDFKIKKFRDYRNKDENGQPKEFKNLYSLVGNTEVSLNYEGQAVGYFSPLQTLAYKDSAGEFKILDENTDLATYTDVTGNSEKSYNEFRKVAAAYKKLHTELTGRLLESGGKELTLSNPELKDLMDVKMSQGELDLVEGKVPRPDLGELSMSGVKIGNKMVPTVVNVDANDAVKVLMDKSKKTKGTIRKHFEVDRWANQHLDDIKKAMTDEDGTRLTDNVAVIETKDGDYKIISLRPKEGVDLSKEEDFVDGLGNKFTASVNKNVFKNESLQIIPKQPEEKINIDLSSHKILSEVFPQEDVDSLAKFGMDSNEIVAKTNEDLVDEFLSNADDQLKQDLEDMNLDKAAIIEDYTHGSWSSIEDYLNDLKNC